MTTKEITLLGLLVAVAGLAYYIWNNPTPAKV